MNRTHATAIATALMLAGLAACTERPKERADGGSAPIAETSGNVIGNPGFETSEALFAPWVFNIHADPDAFVFTADNAFFKEGTVSLRVQRSRDEPFASVVQYINKDTLPAARYRLSAWVRGENLQSPVYLHTAFFASSYQMAMDGGPEHGLVGTFDWTRLEREITLPERLSHIETGVTTTGDGTLWIDSVELVPISD